MPGTDPTEPLPTFAFLVGCGRSGTTLLRAIFDSHPDVRVPGESRFLPGLIRSRSRFEKDAGFSVAALFEHLNATPWFRHWGLDPAGAERQLRDDQPADLASAVRCLYALQAAKAGKSLYADKSPMYVLHMRTIAELLPESRFVHLVRDGRSVALAYAEANFGPTTVPTAALHWKLRVERGRQAGTKLGDRYLEVRYEDLVEDPQFQVTRICDFIGVRYDPMMLEYPGRAADIVSDDWLPANHPGIFLPPTSGLREWRVDMSTTDQAVFDVLAGRTLEQLGYERALAPRTTAVRVRAARTHAAWNAQRLWHKIQPASHRAAGFSALHEAE